MDINFAVNGQAWGNALDGNITGVPREEGWPEPTRHRRWGRGWQAVYEGVPVAVAKEIRDHLYVMAECWASGVDAGTASDGRACLRAADSIHVALGGEA